MTRSKCRFSESSESSASGGLLLEIQSIYRRDRESMQLANSATIPLTLSDPSAQFIIESPSTSSSLTELSDDSSDLDFPSTSNGGQKMVSDREESRVTRHLSPVTEAPIERGRGKSRRYFKPAGLGNGSRSPRSPDRFIPIREYNDPPSTPLRVGKSTQKLSPEEKLLRRRSPIADPFVPAQPRRSASVPRIQSDQIHSPHYVPHLINDTALTGSSARESRDPLRQVSVGAVWNVGGTSAMLGRRSMANSSGRRGTVTSAPMYKARFLPQTASSEEQEKHESRIALALDIDPAVRLLNCRLWPLLESRPSPSSPDYERLAPLTWKDNAWRRGERNQWTTAAAKVDGESIVPSRPFRILDAPLLRDDFYCSTLAYSPTAGVLAVGLAHRVYLWSEAFGVEYPPLAEQHPSNYVASLSFSSENGGRSILAIGRRNGMLTLWGVFESEVRFEISHPNSITCVAFRPTKTRRLSERFHHVEVDTEDLAVGDDLGNIWYYSVEWPNEEIQSQFCWNGSMTLLAKISAHTQQVCGIAWSPDGAYLATGGNDNACLIFELRDIMPRRELDDASTPCKSAHTCQSISMQCQSALSYLSVSAGRQLFSRRHLISHLLPSWSESRAKPLPPSLLNHTGSLIQGDEITVLIPSNCQKHRLAHSAAVKALAFAPWQPTLLATGGGSNDRCIHFYHTPSGACLATINVYAQVTSLIWSKTRREIVATFGFAQPEHPVRIAVFAWPSCEQIAAIPWGPYGSSWEGARNDGLVDCGRALCAVSYPGRSHVFVPDTPTDAESVPSSAVTVQRGLKKRGQSEPGRRMVGPALIQPRAKEGGLWCSRTVEEGCIIVASSDQSVKFHEVWSGPRKRTAATCGPLGGSQILEGLDGLEKPGDEIIR